MKITPKTSKELDEMKLIPAGEYYFKIVKAQEKLSKSGNLMIEMSLLIWDDQGKERFLNDYLLDNSQMSFKLRHLYEVIGLIEEYESGNIDPINLIGKEGVVKVKISESETYGKRNQVQDYLKSKKEMNQTQVKNNEELAFNDDLPF